jgi:VWFA-related protein
MREREAKFKLKQATRHESILLPATPETDKLSPERTQKDPGMTLRFCQVAAVFVVLTCASLGRLSAHSAGDQLQPAFRASTDVVTIQASVRDARGRLLIGLTPADFEIRDNGELRQILSLRSDQQSPLSLALLVDMSGSMRVSGKVAKARQVYDALLAQLRQGQDEAAVFTFDSSLHERRALTTDLSKLKDALTDFEPFGTTSLYDATAAVARRLASPTSAHKAIVVLTDGIDTSSTLTAAEVSGLASAINVPVFIVATVPSGDERFMMETLDRSRDDATDLRDLAEWTGGTFGFASTPLETIAATSRLVDELRQQYVLAIEAASTNEWRRLDVRVKRPTAKVKARSGYFGG